MDYKPVYINVLIIKLKSRRDLNLDKFEDRNQNEFKASGIKLNTRNTCLTIGFIKINISNDNDLI